VNVPENIKFVKHWKHCHYKLVTL